MGGLKELTGAGSMRTTIIRSPKNNRSIQRSDLSTAGVDKGVPTIGLVVPGQRPTASLDASGQVGCHFLPERLPGVPELCLLVELRSCAIAASALSAS